MTYNGLLKALGVLLVIWPILGVFGFVVAKDGWLVASAVIGVAMLIMASVFLGCWLIWGLK